MINENKIIRPAPCSYHTGLIAHICTHTHSCPFQGMRHMSRPISQTNSSIYDFCHNWAPLWEENILKQRKETSDLDWRKSVRQKKRGERGKKQRRQSPWNRHKVGLNDEKCVTGIYNMKTLFGSFELLKESVQAIASMWLVKRNLWVSLFALHPPHQLIWSVHLYLLLFFPAIHPLKVCLIKQIKSILFIV